MSSSPSDKRCWSRNSYVRDAIKTRAKSFEMACAFLSDARPRSLRSSRPCVMRSMRRRRQLQREMSWTTRNLCSKESRRNAAAPSRRGDVEACPCFRPGMARHLKRPASQPNGLRRVGTRAVREPHRHRHCRPRSRSAPRRCESDRRRTSRLFRVPLARQHAAFIGRGSSTSPLDRVSTRHGRGCDRRASAS